MFGYMQMGYFLFLFGAILFGIYNIIIFKKKKLDNFADKAVYYINLLMLVQCIYCLIIRVGWQGCVLLDIGSTFKLCYGPLFFYVVRSTIYKQPFFDVTNYKLYFHFIPFIVFTLVYIYLLYDPVASLQYSYLYLVVLSIFSGIHILVYCVLSLYIMQNYELVKTNKRVKKLYFDGLMILIFRGIYLIGDGLERDFTIYENDIGSLFSYILMFMVVILIHRVWIKDYFVKPFKEVNSNLEKSILEKIKSKAFIKQSEKPKYSKSRVDLEDLKSYSVKLENLEIEVFLDKDLGIDRLASLLHISTHSLSQTFSLVLQTSYSTYIHKKRVQYTVKLLGEQPDLSISELSEESGFNSQASFYRAFKEVHNMTPREFQKQHIL